jgi:hypothetical protein
MTRNGAAGLQLNSLFLVQAALHDGFMASRSRLLSPARAEKRE